MEGARDINKTPRLLAVAVVAMIATGCATGWQKTLDAELPRLGHRNWILVADSAYPLQSRAGIETLYTGAGQLEVVRAVLEAVDKAEHVRANVYLDFEIDHVPEANAPGIGAYRRSLDALLAGKAAKRVPHEDLIAQLDEAAKTFNVLVLKTDLTIPYTSVFFELDCGYWSAQAQAGLRETIEKARSAAPRP
jgi:hypothetical protein